MCITVSFYCRSRIFRRCQKCSMCDDAANASQGTCDGRRQGYILCLGKENRRDSVTHLHIYGISIFVGRTASTGKLFIYSSSVRHTQGLSASKPHEIVPLPGRSIHTDNKQERQKEQIENNLSCCRANF